jgi:hypothetical protein
VPLPSKMFCGALWTISFLVIGRNSAQAQQRGMHGPQWGFAIASAKDARHPRLTRTWNPSGNLDSVWIVMARSHTAPVDSIRLSVRSGPPRLASDKDIAAATFRSDSLGQWVTAPASLLRAGSGERNAPMPMRVLGTFSPTAIASWARSQNPNRPVVTRVAADVWRRNTFERKEVFLESPAVDVTPKPVSAPRRLNAAKPVRK